MLGLLLVQQPGLLPSRRASAGRGHDRRVAMTIAMPPPGLTEAQEEAYWRRWFWDQAEEEITKHFKKASKRDLKRVRDYINFNRDDDTLPKKLAKNPQYEVIGGYFPGLTTTPFHDAKGLPWDALAAAYPAIKQELEGLYAREQVCVHANPPSRPLPPPAVVDSHRHRLRAARRSSSTSASRWAGRRCRSTTRASCTLTSQRSMRPRP